MTCNNSDFYKTVKKQLLSKIYTMLSMTKRVLCAILTKLLKTTFGLEVHST